jgi:hypothetical protein
LTTVFGYFLLIVVLFSIMEKIDQNNNKESFSKKIHMNSSNQKFRKSIKKNMNTDRSVSKLQPNL